jgi:hypothetical protein
MVDNFALSGVGAGYIDGDKNAPMGREKDKIAALLFVLCVCHAALG